MASSVEQSNFLDQLSLINEKAAKLNSETDFQQLNAHLIFCMNELPNLTEEFKADSCLLQNLQNVIEWSVNDLCNNTLAINQSEQHSFVCATNCFRLCRNACAISPCNQTVISKCSNLIEVTYKSLLRISKTVLARSEDVLVLLRCAVQFLGNYSSGNQDNKLQIWKNFPEVFKHLLAIQDSKLHDYTLMVMHLVLGDIGSHLEPQDLTTDGWHLLTVAVQSAAENESEKGLLVIEDSLKLPGFCENVLKQVTVSSKLLVCEVMINTLKRLPEVSGDGDQTSGVGDSPAVHNIQYLSADFLVQAHLIPYMAGQSTSDTLTLCTVKELECLCLASAHHQIYGCLQDNEQLIKISINLLQSIEDIGRQGNNVFTNLGKISQQGQVDTHHPVYGLKRDLIRLLGNLAFKHKTNQDLIRELNGISLILDKTNIDGKNPFISQWSIYAIHNLTEDNDDNRRYISELKLQGVANNQAVLEEMGLEATTDNSGRVTVKKKKTH